MKYWLCFTILASLAWADVECLTANGEPNGVWASATINSFATKVCSGSTRPVYYRVTRGTATDANARLELNRVAEDAWLGDTIMLQAGDVWTIPAESPWQITRRTNGTGYLTITTTEYAKLPADGTRITPAYIPLMPIMQVGNGNTHAIQVLGTGSTAEHIRIRGLYFRPKPGTTAQISSAFIMLGSTFSTYNQAEKYFTMNTRVVEAQAINGPYPAGYAGPVQVNKATGFEVGKRINTYNGAIYTIAAVNTNGQHSITLDQPLKVQLANEGYLYNETGFVSLMPDDVIIQHCIINNPGMSSYITRLVSLDGRSAVLRDSFLSGAQANGTDTQIVSSFFGEGPLTIENNYLDGGSETIMFGGAYSHTGQDVKQAMIRFNFIGHIPERDTMQRWVLTQPTFSPVRMAGISMPGLPPLSPRLVFAGRHVNTFLRGDKWYRAKNTGVVGTTEPPWSNVTGAEVYDYDPARESYGVTWCDGKWNPGDGVCWVATAGDTSKPLIKNNVELKAGDNVTLRHNVIDWFGPLHSSNGQQAYSVLIKGNGQALLRYSDCTDGLPFPYCHRAAVSNFVMENNIVRGHPGGLFMRGTATHSAPPGRGNGRIVRNNLFLQYENPYGVDTYTAYFPLFLSEATDDSGQNVVPLHDVTIEKNTFYSPFVQPYQAMELSVSTTSAGYAGHRTFSGNIWARGVQGAVSRGSANRMDGGEILTNLFPGTATGGIWGKNIVLGASSTPGTWPADTVWTGCPSVAPCITSTAHVDRLEQLWSQVFRNPLAGDFTVRDDHPGKRALPDDSDIGADTTQLPEIRNLTVSPTSSSVIFRWAVSEPIRDIPCVAEVHTAPDFESGSYAGELSQIDKYYRQDSDDAPQNTRVGAERMISFGNSVPLAAATAYYYRLHCGGDVRRGMFTTLPAAAEETPVEQIVSRVLTHPAAKSMVVEFGTAYDRVTDTITGAQEGVAACEPGQTCSVSFWPPRRAVVYYRWKERDADGNVVLTGDTLTLVSQ